MYKTGALLRPQHFSECHKCGTNEVRSRAAEWQGSPGLLQSQAETWLTWDETHYWLSPRAGAAATGVGGHSEGLGPHAELRALAPALMGGQAQVLRSLFYVRCSTPGLRNLGPAAQKEWGFESLPGSG